MARASGEMSDQEALRRALSDPMWRLTSGALYKIKVKQTEDDEIGVEAPFRPNSAQRRLLKRLHSRNLVLKARQLGMSTLIDIVALDYALWNKDRAVVIIAQDLASAQELMRDKLKFALDRIPRQFLQTSYFAREKDNESQLVFGNGSTIRVVTSARSGTVHFLHVSEMGKISVSNPGKATEIMAGSLQAVPRSGWVFVESTAEGIGGAFYELEQRAKRLKDAGSRLGPTDFRHHFFGWFEDPSYVHPEPRLVKMTERDHEYFDQIEGNMGVSLSLEQRAWYVAKRDTDFAHDPHRMLAEYPSTPEECWETSTEGKIYAGVVAKARREGRICKLPLREHLPCNTFWDLGATDDTAVWVHQHVSGWDHFLRYRGASGEGYLPFILWLDRLGFLWGDHYLPHDATQVHQTERSVASPLTILREMRPSWSWRVVPRVRFLQHGIDLSRQAFDQYRFDEEGCKEGVAHLEAWSRRWVPGTQSWSAEPMHDEHSHACDALRQHAQAFENSLRTRRGRADDPFSPSRRRATVMTA